MTLEEAIRAHLTTVTALTDVVGDSIRTGYRPPRDDWPALTYFTVSVTDYLLLDGGTDDAPDARVQFNCWGRTAAEVQSIRTALRAALNDATIPGTWGTVKIYDCRLEEGGSDLYDQPLGGEDEPVCLIRLDAVITWEE